MLNEQTIDDGPVRLDVRALPGLMARVYASQAVQLMAVPILVEVDRAAYPMVPVGELLADRLAACEVPDLEATVTVRWPGLMAATESDPCVVEVLELVSEWTDRLLASAMAAAQVFAGGECDGVVAA